MKSKLFLATVVFSIGFSTRGATIFAPITADTTIFELNPTFNLGNTLLGAGAINLTAPGGENLARMRALMKFSLFPVPTNAIITSARLDVTVVRVPPLPDTGSTFELHRLLKDWGEGVGSGLRGIDANPGEATWLAPMSPSPAWGLPGASDVTDSIQATSSSALMDGLDTYEFSSTATMVTDVQHWVLHPETNFGWLMKSTAEDVNESARRFANKESGDQAPSLIITYELPGPRPQIVEFEFRPDGMYLAWVGGVAPFQVERAVNLSGPWVAASAPSDATQALVPADLENAFYRIVSAVP